MWEHYDERTGRRVSLSICFTEAQARVELDKWIARDNNGGRPDLRDVIPHIRYRQVA